MSNTKLVDAVLSWWDKHQYDTTGEYGEYNAYDKEPEFVTIAKEMSKEVQSELLI